MQRFGILIVLFLFSCAKDNNTIDASTTPPDIDPSDLPYLRVTTNEPIENEPKVPGVLSIFEGQELTFTHPIGIEYRGSTSFRLSDKKSYGLETWDEQNNDVDVSILGFPKKKIGFLMDMFFVLPTQLFLILP